MASWNAVLRVAFAHMAPLLRLAHPGTRCRQCKPCIFTTPPGYMSEVMKAGHDEEKYEQVLCNLLSQVLRLSADPYAFEPCAIWSRAARPLHARHGRAACGRPVWALADGSRPRLERLFRGPAAVAASCAAGRALSSSAAQVSRGHPRAVRLLRDGLRLHPRAGGPAEVRDERLRAGRADQGAARRRRQRRVAR